MRRMFFALFILAAACGDNTSTTLTNPTVSSSATSGSTEGTTNASLPDLPPPDPDHPECKIGGSCHIDPDCSSGLVCGAVDSSDDNPLDGLDNGVCGVPCAHDDECKVGVCSRALFSPGFPFPDVPGICVTQVGATIPKYEAEDLCPGTPICARDKCEKVCATPSNDGDHTMICDEDECVLLCESVRDCPEQTDPTGTVVTCEEGRCMEYGSLQDLCYQGLDYFSK